jgi:hypothetical protein
MFEARVGAVVVKLSVVCVADEVGVTVHVDSDGAPVQLKVTGVVNPVDPGTTVMVVLPGLPCFTVIEGTVELSVKVWSVAVVVSEKAVVCVTPEPVALIVMDVVAGAMLTAVVMVMVVVLGFVPSIMTGVGLNAQVAPVGIPVQLGVIGWFIPLAGVKVMVIEPVVGAVCPAGTLVLVGATAIEKSG